MDCIQKKDIPMKVWNATIFLLSLCLLVIVPGALAAIKGENSKAQATLPEETCSSGGDGTCSSEAVVEELPPCEDKNDGCQDWADAGECLTNSRYMYIYCALSCGICEPEK